MFDIGGWEFLVIVVVAIVVIGPKDLPGVIRGVSQWVAKARELAREFRAGLDELSREVELDKLGDEVRSAVGADELESTANSIRNEIEDAGHAIEKSADPHRIGQDEYEEAYTYFDERPDALPADLPADVVPPDVEPEDHEEARRRQEQHAAEERPAAPAHEGEATAGAKPGA